MDDRRRRLGRDQRGTRSPTQDRSRPWTTDASPGMHQGPSRPWQRPLQFQHGHHDNAFGDAESTGALLARLAAAREWEDRPTFPTRQHPRSRTLALVPFDWAHDAAVTYLDLLDQVVADRVITAVEVRRLRQCATDWGISALEAAWLHRGYVALVWERACTDATVTPAELRDIETLADLLGIPFEAWRRVARGSVGTRWVVVPVESDLAPWSTPEPSGEVVGQGATVGQGDAMVARPSRTYEER
jgi:hypothetical protein